MLFFEDFRRHVRQFFGVVLELARPSEARCFPPGRWFFRSCFTAAAAGNRSCQKKSKKNVVFLEDFRRHVRQFFGVVLELARPSEARCFPPGRWFFEAVLLQQPQATEAFEKNRKTCCFSRISEDSLGTFSAPFRGFSALHCHGVWGWRVQCFRGLEGVSFELLSSFFRASFLGFQTTR